MEVYLYDVVTGKLDAVLRRAFGSGDVRAYRPDGKQLATASNDQTIRLWIQRRANHGPSQGQRRLTPPGP